MPTPNSIGTFIAMAILLGKRPEAPTTVRKPGLPILRDYYLAWADGRISTDELRESILWLWLGLGQSKDETMAAELFDVTGYVTDSPGVTLPRTFRAYQGRAAGEPPGMSWSLDPDVARGYSQRSVAGWAMSGRTVSPGLYSGTIAGSDVLLFARTSSEVVVRPDRVRAIRPNIPRNAVMSEWAKRNADIGVNEATHMVFRCAREITRLTAAHPDIFRGEQVHPVDWPELLEAVTTLSRIATSPIHGETHWRRVATLGLDLAATDAAVDPEIVVLFGMIHDAVRSNEGRDIDHGPRAATYAGPMDIGLAPDRFDCLRAALREHSLGTVATDPTIGACWDADRLDLYRLGRTPVDELLSTPAARRPETRQRALSLLAAEPPTWDAIFERVHGIPTM